MQFEFFSVVRRFYSFSRIYFSAQKKLHQFCCAIMMMIENLLRRYNVPKRIWEAKRWYKELDQPEKWLFWMCIGGYFGVFYGTHKRHERERNLVSQHMVVTRYNVAPDDIKHFEQYRITFQHVKLKSLMNLNHESF